MATIKELIPQWRTAAQARHDLANICRSEGKIEDAIPLENAAQAYHRCADELEWSIANSAVCENPTPFGSLAAALEGQLQSKQNKPQW